jgi:hypothetical protein
MDEKFGSIVKEMMENKAILNADQLINVGSVDGAEMLATILAQLRSGNLILAYTAPSTLQYVEFLQNLFDVLKKEGLRIREKLNQS